MTVWKCKIFINTESESLSRPHPMILCPHSPNISVSLQQKPFLSKLAFRLHHRWSQNELSVTQLKQAFSKSSNNHTVWALIPWIRDSKSSPLIWTLPPCLLENAGEEPLRNVNPPLKHKTDSLLICLVLSVGISSLAMPLGKLRDYPFVQFSTPSFSNPPQINWHYYSRSQLYTRCWGVPWREGRLWLPAHCHCLARTDSPPSEMAW